MVCSGAIGAAVCAVRNWVRRNGFTPRSAWLRAFSTVVGAGFGERIIREEPGYPHGSGGLPRQRGQNRSVGRVRHGGSPFGVGADNRFDQESGGGDPTSGSNQDRPYETRGGCVRVFLNERIEKPKMRQIGCMGCTDRLTAVSLRDRAERSLASSGPQPYTDRVGRLLSRQGLNRARIESGAIRLGRWTACGGVAARPRGPVWPPPTRRGVGEG
jgi:hypothetical protein